MAEAGRFLTSCAVVVLSLISMPGAAACPEGGTSPKTGIRAPAARTMTNSIGMKLIYVRPGEFFMGSIETPEELAKKYGARIYAYSWGDDLAGGKLYANMVDDAAHRWIKQFGVSTDDRCPYDDGFATTAPVASFRPNPWGFYDMHGNVNEWCRDWYDKEYYAGSPGFDPPGPVSGVHRSLRGGSWIRHGRICRSASRHSISPFFRSVARGFRVICHEATDETQSQPRSSSLDQ